MRGKGINLDTGFLSAGTTTREPFEAEIVRREMRVIRKRKGSASRSRTPLRAMTFLIAHEQSSE